MLLVNGKIKEYKSKGSLFPLELNDLFKAQRIFWVTGVPKNQKRGGHAHINCRQICICVQGEIVIEAKYAGIEEECVLHAGDYTVINKNIWATQRYVTGEDILLVLTSESYDISDYTNQHLEHSNKETVIVGSGNFAKEVSHTFNIIPSEFIGINQGDLLGIPVNCKITNNNSRIIMAIQIPEYREKMYVLMSKPYYAYENLIHNTANINGTAKIGFGNVIMQNVDIGNNVHIGDFSVIDKKSIVGHNTVVKNFVTMAPAATVSGNCIIGNKVYIGANSFIKENITICDNTFIGAGAVVVKDINNSGKYVGIPAKIIER